MSVAFAVASQLAALSPAQRATLLDRRLAADDAVARCVAEIVARVRAQGDAALRADALAFDGVQLTGLEVPRARWRSALGRLSPGVRDALAQAADNIARVHEAWRPRRMEIEVRPGVRLARVPAPLRSAGVYAPGGRAAYPSSVLMGAIPARVAGVAEVVLCSPPAPGGDPSDAVLAAAEIAGVSRVFRAGGAGAVAALALGTESVPRVECIVGPGNAYVTEAKLQLARDVRTDVPAGPSELLIVADAAASAGRIAAEIAAQAEHGDDSAIVLLLIATPPGAILDELARQIATQPRGDTIRRALARCGALLTTNSMQDALAFADAYAPEHLLLAVTDSRGVAEGRCAGTVFVGERSSVTFGDYMNGANHVLPTAGYARTQSGLSSDTFVRWTTIQEISADAARQLAAATSAIAMSEGLAAHAAAALRAGASA